MTNLPPPLSRQDMQQLTRRRLVFAAREVFARDGYHGANLDLIAREAGYSKGAVYSNFENKSNLFLAVMDDNIRAAADPPAGVGQTMSSFLESNPEVRQAIRGFALATLEFIATAARDETLARECGKRVLLLIDAYADYAQQAGADPDRFAPRQLGALLAALDQGSAMLSLAGVDLLTDASLNLGLDTLIGLGAQHSSPTPAADHADADSPVAFHSERVRRNIGTHLAEAYLPTNRGEHVGPASTGPGEHEAPVRC